jgi:hypothetical protein
VNHASNGGILRKQLGVVASLIAAALVLTGCAQIGGVLRSEAWNAGHSFGSNLSSSSYMEAFAGCQFAQPQVFPTSSESAYNDFMDGCTTAALSDSGASTSDGNEFESGSDSGQSALGEYPQEGQQYETSAVNLMREEVSFLDSQSSANWTFSKSGDPFGTAIGIVFDDYGGDGGCAIWWYESESDAQLAILNGKVNFFSEFYGQWTYTSGPSMILVAESASHPCYIDATRILKLDESYSPGEPGYEEEAPLEVYEWEPFFEIEQWGEFESYVSGCSTFACGNVQLKLQYTPPREVQAVLIAFYIDEQLVGRFDGQVNSGSVASLLDLDFTGIPKNGNNAVEARIYLNYSDDPIQSVDFSLLAEFSAIETLFAKHPEFYSDWQSSRSGLSDPYSVAQELVNAGVCDRISDLGNRVRCSASASNGLAPGYDAYIYTRAADIVGLTQGYTYDNTVFYSKDWAVSVYYAGWKASETDIVERMSALDWSVIGQDWRDPASCIGSCFVSR